MDNASENPVLVERECGGWLASGLVSGTLRIGVTSDTEAGAIEKFADTIRAWRRNLSAPTNDPLKQSADVTEGGEPSTRARG